MPKSSNLSFICFYFCGKFQSQFWFAFVLIHFHFPSCSAIRSDYFPPEVVTHEQWAQLKPEPKSLFSGWIKGAFRGGKKEMQEPIHQKLNSILTTAPTWDRFVAFCALDFLLFILYHCFMSKNKSETCYCLACYINFYWYVYSTMNDSNKSFS